jgi:hypothetical protein
MSDCIHCFALTVERNLCPCREAAVTGCLQSAEAPGHHSIRQGSCARVICSQAVLIGFKDADIKIGA